MHNRTCGTCVACCIAFEIKNVPAREGTDVKPSGHLCRWVLPVVAGNVGACAIHDTEIYPSQCKDYMCQWLQGIGPDAERPDQLGMVIDYRDEPKPGYYVREVRDVLSNPYGRAVRVLTSLKKKMYRENVSAIVVCVTRFDGSVYLYQSDGSVLKSTETGDGKPFPIVNALPERLVQIRRKGEHD